MSYTSNDLMAAVKRYGNIPTSQITFLNTDFYALADDSIRSKLVPLILKHCEEFYVYPCNYNVTSGQAKYAIPPRAINMMLRSVQIVSGTDPDTRVNLDRLNIEDLYGGISGNARALVKKSGFYVEGNNVVMYPTPQQTADILRLNYFIRPNQLVDVSACAQVSGTFALNTQTVIQIYRNGSAISGNQTYAGGAETDVFVAISDVFNCLPGDTIQIYLSSGATSAAIVSSNIYNVLSIILRIALTLLAVSSQIPRHREGLVQHRHALH